MRATIRFIGILIPALLAAYITYGVSITYGGSVEAVGVIAAFILAALIFAALWSGFDNIIFRYQLKHRYGLRFTLNETGFLARADRDGFTIVKNKDFPTGVRLRINPDHTWELLRLPDGTEPDRIN